MGVGPEYIVANMPHLAEGFIPDQGEILQAEIIGTGETVSYKVVDFEPDLKEMEVVNSRGKGVWKKIPSVRVGLLEVIKTETLEIVGSRGIKLWLDDVQKGRAGVLEFPQFDKIKG